MFCPCLFSLGKTGLGWKRRVITIGIMIGIMLTRDPNKADCHFQGTTLKVF